MTVKMASLTLAAAALACAGGASSTEARIADRDQVVDTVQVNGPLRLELHDMPLFQAPSALNTAPVIAARAGAITVSKSQFGSLCRYAVTGSADTQGERIGVHLVFAERLTMCTADVRVLRYEATVTTAPGTYSVALIHQLNGAVDTIARQSVTVP